MRILYASERPPYPFFLGGAARCAHEIIHQLVTTKNVECYAVGSSNFSNPPWSFPESDDYEALGIVKVDDRKTVGKINCGYSVEIIASFHTELEDYIESFLPDIIWAQMEGAQFVIEAAWRKNVRSILFVHDAEFDPQELKALSNKISGVVCSSQFLAKKIHKAIGLNVQIVYPCPQVDFNVTGDSNGYLTMINPHRVKGLDTFLKIAQSMPDEKFLLVESWKLTNESLKSLQLQLSKLPNVEFIRRVSDMRNVYQQTKLLLVPSVWEEGFGMVAVEAQSCRIPVIASDRGGLPEAVGNGGVLIKDFLNSEIWVKEIKRFLTDESYFSKMSQLAFEHAHHESLSTAGSARRFLEFCEVLLTNKVGFRENDSFFKKLIGFLQ